ncbi:MAG: hypothetical protein RLY87_478 [Chloroflexota bacterium]|jgi:uncharacterized protein YndB with AHSA1/START domain
MDALSFTYVIYIRADIQSVWNALTDPTITQQYWHDTRLESSWAVGDELLFVRQGEVTDRNTILEFVPPQLLRYTFKPLYPDFAAEAPSRVSMILDDDAGVVRLTLVHDAFPPESMVLPAIRMGWPMILSSLKTVLETGTPLVVIS